MRSSWEDTDTDLEQNPRCQFLEQNLQLLDDEVPAYTILNLGVGWQSPEGRLALRAFVNNALNTAYATLISSSATNHQRWYNEPRLAGVRMMLTW